jgi:hypothetical protein
MISSTLIHSIHPTVAMPCSGGHGAVDIGNRNKKCEGCKLKRPTFGLPAEGKRRWCSGCAKAHAGVVRLR